MSTSGSGPALLPGQSAPLLTITPTDQRGVVAIAAALSLVVAAISTIIRYFIRREFRNQFEWDDWASFAAMALFVVQTSLVCLSLSHGFGDTAADLSAGDIETWQKDAYASEISYPVILWLTRCSIVALYIRLTPDRRHILASYGIVGLSTILALISVLLVALKCTLARPWNFVTESCSGLLERWIAITIFNIFLEVALFACAAFLMTGLQLPMIKKVVVLVAFGQRLLIIAPSALRLYWLGLEYSSTDPSLDGVLASVCMQIELSWAIVATTTACLRPFMSALNTHYGGPVEGRTQIAPSKAARSAALSGGLSGGSRDKSHGSSGKASQPISMVSITPRSEKEHSASSNDTVPMTRWDQAEYHCQVAGTQGHVRRSLESGESRQMIINKDTTWAVDFDDPESQSHGIGRAT